MTRRDKKVASQIAEYSKRIRAHLHHLRNPGSNWYALFYIFWIGHCESIIFTTTLSHQFHTNTHKNVKTLQRIVTNYGISKKIQEKSN
jgi:hypothetical protein